MPLTTRSLFLYGFQVTEYNRSIDFVVEPGGEELQATMTLGYYSLTSLLVELKRAMEEADLDNVYTVMADRTLNGGTENRVSIITDGAHLDLLFSSGTRAGSSVASLIGFPAADQTGGITYTGTTSAGTVLITTRPGSKYVPPTRHKKVAGSLQVTASGRKEAIIYSSQRFWQADFQWIHESAITEWESLMDWLISQRSIDFTPSISAPSTTYECTLESTPADSKGMAFQFNEKTPAVGWYDTGLMKFRVKE